MSRRLWADRSYLKWTSRNLARISKLGMQVGPQRVPGLLKRYPWMKGFFKVNRLTGRLMGNRRGAYREATGFLMNQVVHTFSDMIVGFLQAHDRIVWHEDMVPPEIFRAMGLHPFMIEMLGITIPLLDPAAGEGYLDEAALAGVPVDSCTLPRLSLGIALRNEYPEAQALVASNSPCDSGMTSYAYYEKMSGVPTFRLDLPYRFREDDALDYYAGELLRMVDFLEEHTSGRMDWDHLKEICQERNRAVEYRLEFWDLLRQKPAPLGSDVVYLSNLIFYALLSGKPEGTALYKRLVEYAKKSAQSGGGLPDEKYRVLLWNPPTLIFPELFTWAEDEFSATMIMDMLTWNSHPFIDVSTRESMLQDLARIIMEGPMAQHTLGPVDYFFDDMFFIVDHFSIDTIWMAAHLICKNTQALLGMMREKCRERKLPLLTIDYDLADSRVVSAEDIQNQVTTFMRTVMSA